MTIRVYSGNVLVEEVLVANEEQCDKVCDYWLENGFKVRVSE